jgi:hypothetical protein
MAELRSIDGLVESVSEADVELDSVAFFKMSSASAEQVTLQIRSMMERAWEYIAIAYQGRAHLALGYASWDEYVDDRLGDLRLTVPREQRGAVVQSLTRAQMSLRAIAKVLGVSVATAYRDASAGDSERSSDENAVTIQGLDGRQYRKRRTATPVCPICGEVHEEPPDECPWDLFAQGRGPRPGGTEQWPSADVHTPDRSSGSESQTPGDTPVGPLSPSSIVDSVTRALCLVDELAGLPELVDEIEIAGVPAGEAELVRGVRELIEHLRHQADAIVSLADRLERCLPSAEPLPKSATPSRLASHPLGQPRWLHGSTP